MALKVGIIGNGGIANAHMDGYLALGDEVELVACDVQVAFEGSALERESNVVFELAVECEVVLADVHIEVGETLCSEVDAFGEAEVVA